MTKRVFITGSEGFTGQYVCDEFNKHGWEVWRSGTRELAGCNRYVQIDLLDLSTLRAIPDIRPDVVIHLGGVAFVANDDPSAYYKVHVMGTRNLLETMRSSGHRPERLILASSSNVYGNPGEAKLKETARMQPLSDYAVSKLAMEYMSKLFERDLNIVIARCFNYTGVGQSEKFLIPKIVKHFRDRSECIELGNLDVSRDFSDVRDIARYYLAVSLGEVANEAINFCSGTLHSLHDVVERCTEISGHTIKIVVKPEYVRNNEIQVLSGDNTKLSGLPLVNSPIALCETLQWMLTESV